METLLAQKLVQPAIVHGSMAFCPTMDLIALATVDGGVHVFRFNGQEALSIGGNRGEQNITTITWKPDGQSLAFSVGNRDVCITSARTGKVVHRIDCSNHSSTPLCCVGWGVNVIHEDSFKHLSQSILAKVQEESTDLQRELPDEIASLSVETLLPKPSTLSAGGVQDDLFSTRASIDTIFTNPTAEELNLTDVFVLGFEDGVIHMSICDSFEIGKFHVNAVSEYATRSRPIKHSFHPHSTTHSLILHESTERDGSIHLLPVDLRLLSHAGRNIATLASKSTQMRHLLRYIHQAQTQIHNDFKAASDLPRRLMANINETLSEKGEWTWKDAAFHLLVTGHCPEDVKEWLVDQLGEWGHKRWDKAVTAGYNSIRRLAHENLLPALERFMVLASRLRGLSKFSDANVHLGLSTRKLDIIIETVSCLQLSTHKILLTCNAELHGFQAFSTWLRQQIDMQSIEDDHGDNHERNTAVDHVSTLRYIRDGMITSGLLKYLNVSTSSERTASWAVQDEESLYERYRKDLETQMPEAETSRIPRLGDLTSHLRAQCDALFDDMVETQRRGVRFGHAVRLAQSPAILLDAKMICLNRATGDFVQYVIIGGTMAPTKVVTILQIPFSIENGMSTFGEALPAKIAFGDWKLDDIRFLDDFEILAAVSNDEASRLVVLRYRNQEPSTSDLHYRQRQSDVEEIVDLSASENLDEHTYTRLPGGISWATKHIETQSRTKRRAACVVAQDSLQYRVYDLGEKDSRN